MTDMMLSVFSSRYCRDARVGEESWFLVPMCFSHQAPAAKVAGCKKGAGNEDLLGKRFVGRSASGINSI